MLHPHLHGLDSSRRKKHRRSCCTRSALQSICSGTAFAPHFIRTMSALLHATRWKIVWARDYSLSVYVSDSVPQLSALMGHHTWVTILVLASYSYCHAPLEIAHARAALTIIRQTTARDPRLRIRVITFCVHFTCTREHLYLHATHRTCQNLWLCCKCVHACYSTEKAICGGSGLRDRD